MAKPWHLRQKEAKRKLQLGWFEPRRCWKKYRHGKTYYFRQPNSRAGYEAALLEWAEVNAALEAEKLAQLESEKMLADEHTALWKDLVDVGAHEAKTDAGFHRSVGVVIGRRQTAIGNRVAGDTSLAANIEKFLGSKAKQRTVGRYGKLRCSLNFFAAWIGQHSSLKAACTAQVLQDFYDHLMDQLNEGTIPSRYTARDHLQVVKQFVDNRASLDLIPRPSNLHSRDLTIKVKGSNGKPAVFAPDEFRSLLANATAKTKLYLLLMANTGATQIDLAELDPAEVDWKDGRIVRKRSKTDEYETVPTVNYKLWPETFALLKAHGNREAGRPVLQNANGGPLVQSYIRSDGVECRIDNVKSAFNRLVEKLKRRKLLPKKFGKTPTDIRNTGANLLYGNKQHRVYHDIYLGHATKTVAENHYLQHGEPDPDFDKAVARLRQRLLRSDK